MPEFKPMILTRPGNSACTIGMGRSCSQDTLPNHGVYHKHPTPWEDPCSWSVVHCACRRSASRTKDCRSLPTHPFSLASETFITAPITRQLGLPLLCKKPFYTAAFMRSCRALARPHACGRLSNSQLLLLIACVCEREFLSSRLGTVKTMTDGWW